MSEPAVKPIAYYDYSKWAELPLPLKTLQALEHTIIHEFFGAGPKDGHCPKVKLAQEIGETAFETWSPRKYTYDRSSRASNKLYWEATVQATWETSVLRRGIQIVEGHPILFARRLATKHFETFEVRALHRTLGFTASVVPGFVFRLNEVCQFHTVRKLGIRRFQRAVRDHTVALLNQDILT